MTSIAQRIVNRPSALFFGLAFVAIGLTAMLIDVDDLDQVAALAQVVFTSLGAATLASVLVAAFRRSG